VINEGRDDVNTIASSLEHIASAVGEASERAEEIFLKADTQTRDASRMVSSMDEIARVAAGNAKATQEVVETTGEQLDAMEELVSSTRGVTDLSEELRGVLQSFQTGGSEETS
jgi:methyl-accepting chemotaxis protein